ncbi:hypothetical protein ABPG75_000302 [Micractinium tetrahymenae]
MLPPLPSPIALRPPASPAGAAPPANYKSPLKELFNRWLHVDPVYDTNPIPGTSSQSPLQHRSRVLCPAISQFTPAGEELLLAEFTCDGYGRSRKDAEQDAAKAALQHIATVAPALGVAAPHLPAPPPSIDGTLQSAPSPGTYYPQSTAAPSSTQSPGSTSAPSSAPSTVGTAGGRSDSLYQTPRTITPPAEEAAAAEPAGPGGHAAGGGGSDAAELQGMLQGPAAARAAAGERAEEHAAGDR